MEKGNKVKLYAYGCEYTVTITDIDTSGIWGDYTCEGRERAAAGLWPWYACKKIEVIV